VAALETAFATKLERLALPGGRIAYTNTSSPTLAAGIGADVQSVIGLSNVFTPHREGLSVHRPAATHAVIGAASAAAVSSPSDSAITSCAGATAEASSATAAAVGPLPATTAYVAQQLAQSYDFEPLYAAGDEGQGVTVGIYELEPNFASDITAFQNCYGISSAIKYVETDGGAGTASASNEDGVETELDIENVMELAPKASVDVFQSPNSDADALAQYSDMITGTAGKLNVISTSWGDCEAEEGSSDQDSENTLFQEAATQGISVVAASGDDGAEDCELPTGTAIPVAAVDDPASQPFVTGAGGTSLTALGNAPATKPTEVVWNSGVLNDVLGTVELEVAGAGGGGVSETWEMPSYQSAAPASLNTINSESSGSTCSAASGDCREVPDVSADADYDTGYTVYWNGSWTVVGGTSGAAPLWAAMFADADAESVCQAHGDIGFANAALYHVAGSSTANYAGAFNDVTSGNNDLDDANGGAFAAGTGYDMASGLGSPVAGNLAPALCDAGDGLTITPTAPSPTVAASTTTTTTTSTPATSTVAKATVTGASNTTTVSQSATRTTVKGTCKLPAKLSFLQHPGPPTREIKAVLSVDGRVVRTVTGRRILDVVLTRPKATKFTLKLVTTLSSGEVVSHQLTYSGCKSSSPTVRVLHQADTGSAAKRK
jgi:subtilase family serine protease